MKINLSWALGFKLCTVLYAVGLIGAVLLLRVNNHQRKQ